MLGAEHKSRSPAAADLSVFQQLDEYNLVFGTFKSPYSNRSRALLFDNDGQSTG